MTKQNWIYIIIAVVAVIVGFAIYYQETHDEDKIVIGAIIFLTGPQATLGEEVNNALALANELENQDYEQKIRLAVEDSQDNPSTAITAYNKLRADGVKLFVSTGDQVGYALSPIANQERTVLLNTVAASQEISGEHVFRGFITAEQQAEIMGDYAVNNMGLQRIGLIHINNIYGESYRDKYLSTIGENNGEVVSVEAYGIEDSDVRTQILKTFNENPDAIAVAGFGPAYSLVFKQLRELGWEGIILTDNTLSIPYFFNAIGTDNLNNTYFTSTNFDAASPVNDEMREFTEKYRERFNSEPGFVGAFAFDSYMTLASTIRECGYDPELVKDCLTEVIDGQGILGTIDFSSREMKVPLYIKKVEGKEVTVKEIFE